MNGGFQRRKKDGKILSISVRHVLLGFWPPPFDSFLRLCSHLKGIESPGRPNTQLPTGFPKSGGVYGATNDLLNMNLQARGRGFKMKKRWWVLSLAITLFPAFVSADGADLGRQLGDVITDFLEPGFPSDAYTE